MWTKCAEHFEAKEAVFYHLRKKLQFSFPFLSQIRGVDCFCHCFRSGTSRANQYIFPQSIKSGEGKEHWRKKKSWRKECRSALELPWLLLMLLLQTVFPTLTRVLENFGPGVCVFNLSPISPGFLQFYSNVSWEHWVPLALQQLHHVEENVSRERKIVNIFLVFTSKSLVWSIYFNNWIHRRHQV